MTRMGWVLVVLGVAQMIFAGQMDVSAPGYADMANIDLIAQRHMVFNGGGFAFVAGVVALAAAHVAKATRPPEPSG